MDGCKVLWSDNGFYMNDAQTATLSEPLSSQHKGIVLHWQAYVPGDGTKDYWHNYAFVPKTHASSDPGQGVSGIFNCGAYVAIKYVYVFDDRITGNAANANASYALLGTTIDNRRLVLTEVLGV